MTVWEKIAEVLSPFSLKTLIIKKCDINDNVVVSICKHLKSLEKLDLSK